jgi:hypothetical protein
MAPFVFLANRGNLTRATLYQAIRQRLGKEPGCEAVRLVPSRARPRSVRTNVTPEVFLGSAYPTDTATLDITVSYPRTVDYEYYGFEWSEAERQFGVGWHQDETHPALGECHLQLDHGGETIERRKASFLDDHPLNVLETRFEQLRSILPAIEWSTGTPRLPDEYGP